MFRLLLILTLFQAHFLLGGELPEVVAKAPPKALLQKHWAFLPPTRPVIPAESWGNNDLDKFIAAQHRIHGLTPNQPEDPARLLRRLTLDLTGLPPSPKEVASFREIAAQDLSTAVELAAGRLLATDDYAEHFARRWLDAARYADTPSAHLAHPRTIWPYRDWVIHAFRQNMPFDQFTREQLAGDLLPKPTLQQRIATGFNHCIPTPTEDSASVKKHAAAYAANRVTTTSAIWLGLSTGCAACHDHQSSSISQKDFYALSAFFRNTKIATTEQTAPVVFAAKKEDLDQLAVINGQIEELDQALTKQSAKSQRKFQSWLSKQKASTYRKALAKTPADLSLPLLIKDGQTTVIEGPLSKAWPYPWTTREVAGIGQVAQISDINLDLGELAQFAPRDQVTFSGFLYLDGTPDGPIISRMDSSTDYRGWDLWLEGGHLGAHLIDAWPDKAIKAVTTHPLQPRKWHHFTVTYDGQAAPQKSLTIYINGKSHPLNYTHTGEVSNLSTQASTRLGARHPNSRLSGKVSLHRLQFFKRLLTPEEVAKSSSLGTLARLIALSEKQRTDAQRQTLQDHYLTSIDGPAKKLTAQRDSLIQKRAALKKRGATTPVTEEKEGPASARILAHGEYTLEKEKIYADIPALFRSSQTSQRKSRKDLADWLLSEQNPLTARVTVNRIWSYFFGRGIVETTEDFGTMGARPTHPELLDYLALEFIENDWDLQHIITLITASATYQQSEIVDPATLKKDAPNHYLSRSPRHRLEPEQLRDLALTASGLLVKKVGGPSVRPYQQEHISDLIALPLSNSRIYLRDTGEGLYRRSLYTLSERTAAPPSVTTSDSPTRQLFCVRQNQPPPPRAIVATLNDPQFIEAARVLATTALKQSTAFSQRLDAITMTLIARTLNNEEQDVVKNALEHYLKKYRETPALAIEFLSIGESKPAPSLDQAELASWTLIVTQMFNLGETRTK